ncbi:hypothetical protein EON79_18845 [bacterium]|nr:MAG: hypothetical protein EON79_18845 [bacterium]
MSKTLALLLVVSALSGALLVGCGSGDPEPTKESFAPRPKPEGYNPGAAGAPAVKAPTTR